MIVIPIRTEASIRRTPYLNQVLLGANLFLFLLFDERVGGAAMVDFKAAYLALHSMDPSLHQFLTYQFLHGDEWHLIGNMLFLWVFGNAVNAKMGDIPYLLFYLAGGVFAAWWWAVAAGEQAQLIGASGAIAAVTTAYLALFPRSRVTVLFWFFLIHFFELPAMVLIGLKIIVWDNILAPQISGAGSVAYSAHLAGYLFGFAGALGMLFIHALPRDQFDILALWKRWYRRREFASVMSDPAKAARAQFGTAARVPPADPQARADEERHLDRVSALRAAITDRIAGGDVTAAADEYERLAALDSRQCLSEFQQLAVAREFCRTGRYPQAAAAFDRFVETYPSSREVEDVRLLLGIIYARDLMEYEMADRHLTRSMEKLHDDKRREQCLAWLRSVRAALSRPAPDY